MVLQLSVDQTTFALNLIYRSGCYIFIRSLNGQAQNQAAQILEIISQQK
jgi:hypothetical protein